MTTLRKLGSFLLLHVATTVTAASASQHEMTTITMESFNATFPSHLLSSPCFGAFPVLEQHASSSLNATLAASLASHVLSSNATANCYFDLVRYYVASGGEQRNLRTAAQEDDVPIVSNEEIQNMMLGVQTTRPRSRWPTTRRELNKNRRGNGLQTKGSDFLHRYKSAHGGEEDDDSTNNAVVIFSHNEPSFLRGRDRALGGDPDQCLGSVIGLVSEAVSMILCLVTFGTKVGKAIGRAVGRKMKSSSINNIKDEIQGSFTDFGSLDDQASAIANVFGSVIDGIGFGGLMESIFANTKWYEWALILLVIAAQLLALAVTGGASLAVQVLAKLVDVALFGIAIQNVLDDCEGVGSIGCNAFPGFDFYEDLNSDGGNIIISNRDLHEIADVCRRSNACKGFNTDSWVKTVIRPFDEWENNLKVGGCRGIFVKPEVDICRNDIEGYTFYESFDVPGNTISSFPSKPYKEIAKDCNARGSACQGFNTEGDMKSGVGTTPEWNRPTNKCQGLYVKEQVNVCPVAPGYTFYQGRDFKSSNLTTLPDDGGFVDRMLAACDDKAGNCKGFTTYGSLKTEIASASDWVPIDLLCYGVYVRDDIAVTCTDLENYEYIPNRDSHGNDIRRIVGASSRELATFCDEDPTCEAFNTDYYLKHNLHTTFWGTNTVNGLCGGLYVKKSFLNPAPVFCENYIDEVGPFSQRTTVCNMPHHGQTRFIWKTVGTSVAGLDDDEYYIKVFQDGNEVYRSSQKFDEASGSSGNARLGDPNGGHYVVKFDCDLENPFASCEGGTFEFKLVDCGCPGGEDPLLDCDVSALERARNAVCPATPEPSMPPSLPPSFLPSLGPTPLPTSSSPTASLGSSSEAPGSGCFSGETQVHVLGKGLVDMQDLALGDSIMTTSGYEPIYMFGHVDRDTSFLFLKLEFEGSSAVELTSDHLVFVKPGSKQVEVHPARASSVQVGDYVLISTGKQKQYEAVRAVSTVSRLGLYLPLTKSGTIVVGDGIVASQYIAGQPMSDTLHFGKIDTTITWHKIFHAIQAGPRMYCQLLPNSYCANPLHKSGIPFHLRVLDSMRWVAMNEDKNVVQYLLFPTLELSHLVPLLGECMALNTFWIGCLGLILRNRMPCCLLKRKVGHENPSPPEP